MPTPSGQFPNFNGINQIRNIGKAEYNALQTTYDKLFTQGFAARANYTFSECRTQGRQGLVNNIGGYRSLWLLGPDWALCDSDAPHIISAQRVATICRSARASASAATRRASSIS